MLNLLLGPARSIPIATFASMTVVTLAYILMAASLTLMIPYYQVHPTAAFSDAFALKGAFMAKIAVSVGALCGMMTSLVPINSVLVFASITAIIALLFDIETLVEFLSIGTLLAYSIVSACVIILRYQPAKNLEDNNFDNGGKLMFSFPGSSLFDRLDPGHAIHYAVVVMIVGFSGFGLCISSGYLNSMLEIAIVVFFAGLSALSLIFIASHHQNLIHLEFKVPLVPFVPALSILTNTLMMLHLAPVTWLRLAFWLIIGLSIYFGYGIHHSREAFPSTPEARFSKSSTYDSVVSTATYGS
ncbi:hypothetical protein DICVIV_06228 [Dictyocaulus viviparus]|uniref:Cationic amino acid transporter C-terminal domain-containing protein n=1 Tax=Dictyocaulus viviparus TaxID=29172 RepID=A0A0D8XVB0_DICVI|nr:hypothetical protein DICVIV_06228 [Dictyocaulus viviparus]